MAYGIKLIHQHPVYARQDKRSPLWLVPYVINRQLGENHVDWRFEPAYARRFTTRAKALAAQPDAFLVTTAVARLP